MGKNTNQNIIKNQSPERLAQLESPAYQQVKAAYAPIAAAITKSDSEVKSLTMELDKVKADFESVSNPSVPFSETHDKIKELHEKINSETNEIKRWELKKELEDCKRLVPVASEAELELKIRRLELDLVQVRIERDELYATPFEFNQEFVLESMAAFIDLGFTSMNLRSEMNTGKTFMLKQLQLHHPRINTQLYISVLQSLNEAVAKGLDFTCYKDLPKTTLTAAAAKAGAVLTIPTINTAATTFNSLPNTHNAIGVEPDLVTIDETEMANMFLVSESIKNNTEARTRLHEISRGNSIVLLNDAHLGKQSELFAKEYFPSRKFITIVNKFQPFKHVKVVGISTVDAHGKSNTKEAALKDVKDWICNREEGEKLAVCCTSKTQAKKMHEALNGAGLLEGLKNIMIHSDTGNQQEVQDVKKNPALFNNYDLVITTPSLAAGISVNKIYHFAGIDVMSKFTDVMMLLTRHDKAPATQTALQLPFRFRAIKRLTVYHLDSLSTCVDLNTALDRLQKDSEFYEWVMANRMGEIPKEFRELYNQHSAFAAEVETINRVDLENLYSNFYDELTSKGCSVTLPTIVEGSDKVCKAELKGAAKVLEEKEKEEVINAPQISKEQNKIIELDIKYDSNSVSNEDKASSKQFAIRENFIGLESVPALAELAIYYDQNKDGVSRAAQNLQDARRPMMDINRRVRGQIIEGKVDPTSTYPVRMKIEHYLHLKLLKFLNDDNTLRDALSNSVLKGERYYGTVEWLREKQSEYCAGTDNKRFSKTAWRKDPLACVVKLLSQYFGLVFESKKVISHNETIKHVPSEFDRDYKLDAVVKAGLIKKYNSSRGKQLLNNRSSDYNVLIKILVMNEVYFIEEVQVSLAEHQPAVINAEFRVVNKLDKTQEILLDLGILSEQGVNSDGKNDVENHTI